MNLTTEMLASAHEADVRRTARAREQRRLIQTCRRWLLGVLPIRAACEPDR
jgi:hypothetical protein